MDFSIGIEGLCVLSRSEFISGAATSVAATAVHVSNPIRLSYVPLIALATVMVARDRKYFADAGVDVDVISVTSTQDSMALLAKERLDASAGGVSAAFFNAVHRGFDMRACASIAFQPKTGAPTCFMIRRDLYDSGITKPQQLKGQRIALLGGAGAAPSYLAEQWLAPLTFHEVDMIPMGMPDTGIAFARKAVAAAVVFSPFTVAFEKRGLAKVVAVQKVGTSTVALMLGKRLLDDRSKAKAVRAAFVRAARDLTGDGYYSPAILEILSKHTGVSIAALKEEPRYAFADGLPLDLPTLEDMQRTFIAERTASFKTPMPPEKISVRL